MRARAHWTHNPLWTALRRVMPGAHRAHHEIELDRLTRRRGSLAYAKAEPGAELELELFADVDVQEAGSSSSPPARASKRLGMFTWRSCAWRYFTPSRK